MYKEHHEFSQPEDVNCKVWRYMDFTKFISLIDSKELYFNRSDNFEDKFEGMGPPFIKTEISIPQKARESITRRTEAINKSIYLNDRKYFAISCWHQNEFESAAMWKLYLQNSEGVAIQTTYQRLRDSFIGPEDIYMGKVDYENYERGILPSGYAFQAFLNKRRSFEHEKEVRAIYWDPPFNDDGRTIDYTQTTIEHGKSISVDLTTLVEKIWVSPYADNWFLDLLTNVIKRYQLDFEVERSKMYDDIIFRDNASN